MGASARSVDAPPCSTGAAMVSIGGLLVAPPASARGRQIGGSSAPPPPPSPPPVAAAALKAGGEQVDVRDVDGVVDAQPDREDERIAGSMLKSKPAALNTPSIAASIRPIVSSTARRAAASAARRDARDDDNAHEPERARGLGHDDREDLERVEVRVHTRA